MILAFVALALAAQVEATGIKAVHRDGQTFITWTDAAEGEAGTGYRYSVYRSDKPIIDLAGLRPIIQGVAFNSGKRFGSAFNRKDRLDPTKPTFVIREGGEPLPMWSGLAVHTVVKPGKAYYAVAVTDAALQPMGSVTPGKSATTEPVDEQVAPIGPIKLFDSKSRGQYSPQTSITGTKNLPMFVELHASQGQGGGAGDYGDYYLWFADASMGWREGLPGVFSVQERRFKEGNRLLLTSRDAIEYPDGNRAMETFWFGYVCVPQSASHAEPRAYPFTERRMLWTIDWAIRKYAVDPNRVYAGGGSMGAWGSTTFALRHPEVFAAVYPNRPRTRQRGMPSLVKADPKNKSPILMDDGSTEYLQRMDMVAFVEKHAGDLPFYGWCCGRRDGFASWKEQIDMARALASAKHAFAFAWNNGDHSSGATPMSRVVKHYPPELFARDRSLPAFRNSSIDDNPGDGDPAAGDMEGGINLGFVWSDVVDEPGKWSASIGNELAKADMTVEVTPRRCQRFKTKPGETVKWSTSLGASGTVVADANGLVTVPQLALRTGAKTVLTISKE